jgi:hypothetical protein
MATEQQDEVQGRVQGRVQDRVSGSDDRAKMDAAAADAQREWWDIEEKHPEVAEIVSAFIRKWVRHAGHKRLSKIISGTGQYADSM